MCIICVFKSLRGAKLLLRKELFFSWCGRKYFCSANSWPVPGTERTISPLEYFSSLQGCLPESSCAAHLQHLSVQSQDAIAFKCPSVPRSVSVQPTWRKALALQIGALERAIHPCGAQPWGVCLGSRIHLMVFWWGGPQKSLGVGPQDHNFACSKKDWLLKTMLLPLPSQRPAPPTEPGSSCHRAEHLHQTVPPLLQIQPSPLGLVRLAEGI